MIEYKTIEHLNLRLPARGMRYSMVGARVCSAEVASTGDGDEWLFRIKVIGLGQRVPRARYPKILATVGAAPQQYPPLDDEDEGEE